MFKVILRLLADVAFYTLTMPIKIVCLLAWAVWSVIDIIKDPEWGINDVKRSIRLIKNTLQAEGYWIKHGYIPEEYWSSL